MNPRSYDTPPSVMGSLPRPGKALKWTMVTLLAIWVLFAVGINWGGARPELFRMLTGDTHLVVRGQIWRLFSAPLLHLPAGDGAVGHILTTLLGLYFLAPSLEKRWGSRRMLLFLYGAAIAGFVTQMLVELVAPAALAARVSHPWFGAVSAVEAVAIAWALSFRGQNVALMFVLPVSSTVLAVFVVGLAVLRLLVGGSSPEGLVSPFGAMLFGWLVGGGEPAPIKKLWLRIKLRRLQTNTALQRKATAARAARLRVIQGGSAEPPHNKHWLN